VKKIRSYQWFSLAMAVLFLLVADVSNAQWTLDVMGSVKKEETNKRLEGATITVKRNGAVFKTLTSPETGKFEVALLPDAIYVIEFSMPGHVTKRIELSTKNVPPEDAKFGFDFPMEMNLFEPIEGLDVSILNQPIAKVAFNPATGYMDYDPEYTKSIQKELDRLKTELAQRLKQQEAERKLKQAEYDKAIASADKAFTAEKWDEAKPLYEKAVSIFPTETYPTKQIAEIKAQVDKNESANKAYADAITEGDAAFQKKEWTKATTSYQKASDLKEKEIYPKNKLKEIETIIANEQKTNEAYNDAIALADSKFNDKEYNDAKVAYQKASTIKTDEKYPTDKIKEIENILLELNKNEKGYSDAITQADGELKNKNYQKAIDSYKIALTFKPQESYPKDKIEGAMKLLAELKQLQEDYNKLITTADASFKSKNYEDAKSDYQEASNLKKEEQYPKDKLAEIESIVNAAAKLDQEYTTAIEQGDKAFDTEKYEAAQIAFEKALTLKALEKYPKDKLAEIKAILKELADKNAEELARVQSQKELDDKYNAFIASADNAFTGAAYEKAKTNYNAALKVKANEKYPQEKLDEIEGILEKLAQEKEENEAKIQAQKEIDDQYNALIKAGDDAFAIKTYDEATEKYTEAIDVKANEKYPKDKLVEIAAILKAIEKKAQEEELAAESEKKKRDYFDALIDEADAELLGENYQAAVAKYNQALGVIPNEKYPKDKIQEVEDILAKIQAEKDNASLAEKEINEKYKKLIIEADNAFSTQDYTKATEKYKAAKNVKQSEVYPQQQLDKIEALLAEKAKNEEEIKLTNNALMQKKEQYNEYIKFADAQFNEKNYEKAKSSYILAKGIMPDETHPQKRIEEINQILADILNKEKNEKELALAEKEKRDNYDKLIYEGDRGIRLKQYKIAQDKFNAALVLYPTEKYPSDKLAEILELLEQEKETPENIAVTNTNNASRVKINDANEKEIEAKIAALLNKKNAEKTQLLQKDKEGYEKEEEIRISGGIKRTNEADKQLDDYTDDMIALKERGDKYHLANAKTLSETKNILEKAENNRIKDADKRRELASKELADYTKEDIKFVKAQEELSKDKAKKHHVFVDDVNETKLVMLERGEKMRTENRKLIEKLITETEKNETISKKRSDELKMDVHKYRAELVKDEERRISASIDRTTKNAADIDKMEEDINKLTVKKEKNYQRNVAELEKFKESINKQELQRLKAAEKGRAANKKLKEKMEEENVKFINKKNKDYYKNVKQLDKFKQGLLKEELALKKNADKRRENANKELLKAKELLGTVPNSQEIRYKRFKTKLDEDRKMNSDFNSDLQAIEKEKTLLASVELGNFYRGEKQISEDLELSKKYAQGVTEETAETGNSITIVRTKVTGNHVDVYERIFYTWGGTFFYKNGVNITQTLWDKESIEK